MHIAHGQGRTAIVYGPARAIVRVETRANKEATKNFNRTKQVGTDQKLYRKELIQSQNSEG